jgi:nitroimidazol reductase NimA-like FMN-containing flavoprotein (pyridoxamine 5'-phosphate oxidase superfamily)
MDDTTTLRDLSREECLALLRVTEVGRIAIVVDEFPQVLPVNYRLVETSARTWIAIRTRPGNVIARAGIPAAFEIDGFDSGDRQGWSVLARGTLHAVDADHAEFRERFDPEPWIVADRDAWLVVDPFQITGRRLQAGPPKWAFRNDAYL